MCTFNRITYLVRHNFFHIFHKYMTNFKAFQYRRIFHQEFFKDLLLWEGINFFFPTHFIRSFSYKKRKENLLISFSKHIFMKLWAEFSGGTYSNSSPGKMLRKPAHCSKVLGPRPFILSKSWRERNPPNWCRFSTIFSATFAEIPVTWRSKKVGAWFKSTPVKKSSSSMQQISNKNNF